MDNGGRKVGTSLLLGRVRPPGKLFARFLERGIYRSWMRKGVFLVPANGEEGAIGFSCDAYCKTDEEVARSLVKT